MSSGGTLNSNVPKLKLEPPRAHEREHLLDQEDGHELCRPTIKACSHFALVAKFGEVRFIIQCRKYRRLTFAVFFLSTKCRDKNENVT